MNTQDAAQRQDAAALRDISCRKGDVFRALIVFTTVINLLTLTPSIYMMQLYDRVLSSRNLATLLMLTAMVIGVYLLISLLEHIRSMMVIRLRNSLDMQLSRRVYTARAGAGWCGAVNRARRHQSRHDQNAVDRYQPVPDVHRAGSCRSVGLYRAIQAMGMIDSLRQRFLGSRVLPANARRSWRPSAKACGCGCSRWCQG